ncbi:MAG: DUF72 domain-containing protein [Candidatus Asgardarchaeia archaeon]
MGQILIGTSGWSYKDWVGIFYSSEDNMLEQYWRIFNTTEINSTFYEYPSSGFIKFIAYRSPRGMIYSVKVHQDITHKKMLKTHLAVDRDLKKFLNLVSPLKETNKLGVLLLQLPPKSPKQIPTFEEFLNLLPNEYKWAVEFRHDDWLSDKYFNLLEKYNVGYVIVDEPLLPTILKVTSSFAYIRWHGHGKRPWYYYLYSVDELKNWIPRVKQLEKECDILYGYFNNHFNGYAVINALQMLKLLGIANKKQLEKLSEIEEYLKRPKLIERIPKKYKTAHLSNVELLLLKLTEPRRFERGKEIPNHEVSILSATEDHIEGKIKTYEVHIDLKNKQIYHNCDDWKKRVSEKRFCKHMVKFFLSLPPDLAEKVLMDIVKNYDDWSFRA